jgi:hypothetical protein
MTVPHTMALLSRFILTFNDVHAEYVFMYIYIYIDILNTCVYIYINLYVLSPRTARWCASLH